jgi:cell division protein FtsL
MVTAGELATYLRRQFTTQVENVEAETAEGQRNYQNLVIDRAGFRSTT